MTKSAQPHTTEEELDVLEAQLAGTLKPIAPPRGLVNRLRARVRMPAREEIVIRLRDWRSLFIVFGGVMSGALLVITVARALFYLSGRRQM